MMIIEQPDAMPPGADAGNPEQPAERPWIDLTSADEVETWIDQYNRDLQQCINKTAAAGCGVCFCLGHGGRIFMHTAEDAILLDVTPEAEWAAPAITAATGVEAPRSRIWVLPDDRLTQLVLGLSSLIASTSVVLSHAYKTKKY
jgi:hypothetical protein